METYIYHLVVVINMEAVKSKLSGLDSLEGPFSEPGTYGLSSQLCDWAKIYRRVGKVQIDERKAVCDTLIGYFLFVQENSRNYIFKQIRYLVPYTLMSG